MASALLIAAGRPADIALVACHIVTTALVVCPAVAVVVRPSVVAVMVCPMMAVVAVFPMVAMAVVTDRPLFALLGHRLGSLRPRYFILVLSNCHLTGAKAQAGEKDCDQSYPMYSHWLPPGLLQPQLIY